MEKGATAVIRALLEWGILPKEGRTNYLSGTVVRATGTIENISTRDGREPQDIRVTVTASRVAHEWTRMRIDGRGVADA